MTTETTVILRALAYVQDWENLSTHDLALQLTTPLEITAPTYEPNPEPAPQVPDYAAGYPATLDQVAALMTTDEYLSISKNYPKLLELLDSALSAADLAAINRLKDLYAHADVGLSTASKQALAAAFNLLTDDPTWPATVLVAAGSYQTPIEIAAELENVDPFTIDGDLIETALATY